jgi:drug/metabolite transporter (DMT)-like permease
MSENFPARNPLWPGVPLALASALLFGASTPFAKLLVETSNPQLLAGFLYLGAGVGLMIGQATRFILGVRNSEAPLRRADAPWMIAIIAFGGILGPLFLMLGLARTSAASGSLLLNLEGLATMAIAWVVYRENVDRRLLLGAAAILAGAVALSWQGQGIRVDEGGLLIAAACLAWGVDNNLTRRLSVADPVVIALTKGVVAGSVNLIIALLLGARLPSIGATGAALVVGFCGVGLSLVLFVKALRHLGSARTGAYFSVAPFLGAIIAIALLGEPITPQLVIAGLLMAFGVWLHLTERHAHEHTHEPIEHEHAHVHDDHHHHAHEGTVTEPHSHWHRHEPLRHRHAHYPDIHHRHEHG